MQMHEVGELVEAQSIDEADDLLEAGWMLVAVISGHRTKTETGPIYVLGKKKLAGMTAAVAAAQGQVLKPDLKRESARARAKDALHGSD